MDKFIADIRKDYTLNGLAEQDVLEHPIKQFKKWFDEAIISEVHEPNGMIVSTINSNSRPSSRVVLLKGIDDLGLVFFTNYNSQKGQDMLFNPFVALNFWWIELERQVRIEGKIEKTSEIESEEYFKSRPRGSQIGAWVSEQSHIIESREVLEARQAQLEEKYKDQEIPRPPHWGGYRVVPDLFEFWQGRASRLHDRLQYKLENGIWTLERLSP